MVTNKAMRSEAQAQRSKSKAMCRRAQHREALQCMAIANLRQSDARQGKAKESSREIWSFFYALVY